MFAISGFSQELDETQELALKKANNYVYQGNKLVDNDFLEAEMAYRKAISNQPSMVAGNYNLGNSYYENGNYEEALFRHQKAIEYASSKAEKHKAYHNIGNILMKNKKCKEAVEAYKNALRNNPSDDETRYNLGLAKICAQQQQDDDNKEDKDKNQEQQDENKEQEDNKDNKNQEGDNNDDKQDQNQEDQDDGKEDEDKEGDPKDEKDNSDQKNDQGDPKDDKKQPQPQPQPGQLSPQQVKSLLEAMNNQEQKVQDKINAEKQKGIKIKTEKDW